MKTLSTIKCKVRGRNINKDEIILTLVNLLTSINDAVEISGCKFDVMNEIIDIPSRFHYSREPTGWRSLKLDIRWLDRRE